MKKIALTFLALFCALCCIFCLASCGNGDNGDKTENKLSASEFSSAIEAAMQSGYTFSYEYVSGATNTSEVDTTNNRYLVTSSGGTTTTNYLFTKEGENYYWYMNDNTMGGEWIKIGYLQTTFNKIATTHALSTLTISGDEASAFMDAVLKDHYDSFQLSGDSYIAENVTVDNVGSAEKIEVTFKDGKVVSLKVTKFLASGENSTISWSYSKFGETSVTLPDADKILYEKLTEEEWQASLATFENTKNFSLQLKTASGSVTKSIMLDGTTYRVESPQLWLRKEGEKYYKYESSYWKNTTEEDYNDTVNTNTWDLITAVLSAFGSKYDRFEYGSNNQYTAETISVADDFTLKNVKITVIDGVITKATCTREGTNGGADKVVEVNDIGVTTIKFPTVEPVKTLSINTNELNLLVGNSETLHTSVTPVNATNRYIINFTTDNDQVVELSNPSYADGSSIVVRAIGAGTATVTAEVDGISVECKVTVVPDTPIGQTFALESVTVDSTYGTVTSSRVWDAVAKFRGENKSNIGKTMITTASNAEVGGTCDFGDGSFESLDSESAYMIVYNGRYASPSVQLSNGSITMTGQYNTDGTLVLKYTLSAISNGDTGGTVILTFRVQIPGNEA